MRIEKVSNGWIVYDDLEPQCAPTVLAIFNDMDYMKDFIESYYRKLELKTRLEKTKLAKSKE